MSTSYASARIGPVRLHGATVLLRPPRFDDYAQWRRIRLRDRAMLEPYWFSSPLSWEQRHTPASWVHECLSAAAESAAGRRVGMVLEIDGRFAGQIELVGIDQHARSAEMSVWVDTEIGRRGVTGYAGSMLLDFGFDTVGLERITAPIAVTNADARRAVRKHWQCEAVMTRYFDAGGARVDHELWAVTRDRIPPGGFAADWLAGYLAAHPASTATAHDLAAPSDPGNSGNSVDRHDATSSNRRGAPSSDVNDPATDDVSHTIARSVILRALARRLIGRLRHVADPIHRSQTVALHDEERAVTVRTWRRTDFAGDVGAPLPPTTRRPAMRLRTIRTWWQSFTASRAGIRSAHGLLFAVEHRGRYVGYCRLFDQDMFDHNVRAAVEVSPSSDPSVATTALRMLITYAIEQRGIWRVACAIPATDATAAAVALAAGLRHEGTLHRFRGSDGTFTDHDLWALCTAPDSVDAGGAPA
ncbi:GNAT family N-acetyltransferase [Nocardia sp. NPDC058666]|uniref:GNAT family N-acetyltransferase n=1 Tax=Nocardia sp. NPDC058666 TaxID=3346587 RepID=UPI0036547619